MWFAIDTLEYLRRGGRIAGAQAWLGSALKIKPILTVESEITPIERVRTSRRAFERMVELLRSRAQDGADAWMVQHIQAPAEPRSWPRGGRRSSASHPRVISEIGTHEDPGCSAPAGCRARCWPEFRQRHAGETVSRPGYWRWRSSGLRD